MLQQMKKRIKNEKGLTLIELLAVIVILAIIAAIAIPAIGNIINNSRDKAILSDISGAVSAAKIANADGACGDDNVCEKADIEFSSDKIDITSVTLTSGTSPVVIAVLNSSTVFKGKKITEKLGDDYNATSKTVTITETKLNKAMGN